MNKHRPARQAETQSKDEKREHIPGKSPAAERENLRIRFMVPDVHFVANAALFICEGIGILYLSFLMPECLKGNNSGIFYPGPAFSGSECGFDIRHGTLGTQAGPEHDDAPEQFPDAMVGEEGTETGK